MRTVSERKILVVDDEDVVRLALRRTVEHFGYTVRFASSGAEALTILSEDKGFDLVISDHLMPSMTGLDLFKKVRNLYPDTMRILVTGYADVEMAISAINDGEIFRFVTKPWDNVDLGVTLALAFEQNDLAMENKHLADTARRSGDLAGLEAKHPGIASLHRNVAGAIVISDEEMEELIGAGTAEAADECLALNSRLMAVN